MLVYDGTPPCHSQTKMHRDSKARRTISPCSTASQINSSDAASFAKLMLEDEVWGSARHIFVVSHGGFIRNIAKETESDTDGLHEVKHNNLYVFQISVEGKFRGKRDFYLVRHCTKSGQHSLIGKTLTDPVCLEKGGGGICGEEELAEWVASQGFEGEEVSVCSSCLTRAQQTAERLLSILQERTNATVTPEEVRIVPYVREERNYLGRMDPANICPSQSVNRMLTVSGCKSKWSERARAVLKFARRETRRR